MRGSIVRSVPSFYFRQIASSRDSRLNRSGGWPFAWEQKQKARRRQNPGDLGSPRAANPAVAAVETTRLVVEQCRRDSTFRKRCSLSGRHVLG